MLDSGGFWLSETPHRHSPGWRTRVVRSANWAKFVSPDTGLSFLHLNTHLDHLSGLARAMGSDLILRETERLRGDNLPAIVTGDFNCLPGSVPYRSFAEDGFEDTFLAAGGEDAGDTGTFHAFGGLRCFLLRLGDRVCQTGQTEAVEALGGPWPKGAR